MTQPGETPFEPGKALAAVAGLVITGAAIGIHFNGCSQGHEEPAVKTPFNDVSTGEYNINAMDETRNLKINGFPAAFINERFYYIDQDGRLVEETGICNIGKLKDGTIVNIETASVRSRTTYDLERGVMLVFERNYIPVERDDNETLDQRSKRSAIKRAAHDSMSTIALSTDLAAEKKEILMQLAGQAKEMGFLHQLPDNVRNTFIKYDVKRRWDEREKRRKEWDSKIELPKLAPFSPILGPLPSGDPTPNP